MRPLIGYRISINLKTAQSQKGINFCCGKYRTRYWFIHWRIHHRNCSDWVSKPSVGQTDLWIWLIGFRSKIEHFKRYLGEKKCNVLHHGDFCYLIGHPISIPESLGIHHFLDDCKNLFTSEIFGLLKVSHFRPSTFDRPPLAKHDAKIWKKNNSLFNRVRPSTLHFRISLTKKFIKIFSSYTIEIISPKWRAFAGQMNHIYYAIGCILSSPLSYLYRDWQTFSYSVVGK